MALVKCRECGEQVSTTAAACPKCGAKPPKKTSAVAWFVLILLVIGAYSAIQAPSTTKSSTASQPGGSATPAAAQKPHWDVSTEIDKMTGKRQVFAASPMVKADERMEFPYSDVKAWLGVGCDGKKEWAYIGFTKSPNLTDTETEHGYSTLTARMKWNNSLENTTLIQEWGASFLHFQNDRQAISKMSTSSSALLELKWYGQQRPHFSFPMDGASNAVKTARAQCATK